MEDSPPRLVQSLLTGCSNQRQVRTPPWPIISQGITFKDHLHGRHHSSAELRPSSPLLHHRLPTPSIPRPTPPPGSDPRGEDVPNHKMFIQTHFILSVHVFLRGLSAKEIIFH
ncbi:hypothetical protein ATANTOWER_029023 [Ataeniobius toweri]|uniref:Uncharacterized protein n=1 Tax=Ataeniobius toweri TaxID=208326 RepID=A0ABU7CGA8_9TELE|nr:hypothetical protein [Ataeniobius toweri]